jgi:hypothetical protein
MCFPAASALWSFLSAFAFFFCSMSRLSEAMFWCISFVSVGEKSAVRICLESCCSAGVGVCRSRDVLQQRKLHMPPLMLSNASANAAGGESDCRSDASAWKRDDMCVWNSSSWELVRERCSRRGGGGGGGVGSRNAWNTKSIG